MQFTTTRRWEPAPEPEIVEDEEDSVEEDDSPDGESIEEVEDA